MGSIFAVNASGFQPTTTGTATRVLAALRLLAGRASASECAYEGQTFANKLVPWTGSYPRRCKFAYPPRPGWTLTVETPNAALGRIVCAAEEQRTPYNGWVRIG
jgi:hypothetical protein